MEGKFEKNGTYKRVTIESYLEDPDVLADLQEELEKKLPDIIMQPPEKLHMTIGHIGKPDELINQLQWVKPNLELGQLLAELSQTLEDLQNVIVEPYTVHPKAVALFSHGAVVLEVSVEDHVFEAKTKVYEAVVDSFKRLGLSEKEAREVIASAHDLKFLDPEEGRFHITLGRVEIPMETDKDIRAITEDISLPEEITLQSSRIRNFSSS